MKEKYIVIDYSIPYESHVTSFENINEALKLYGEIMISYNGCASVYKVIDVIKE